jgi:hypothetical protein
MGYKLTKLYYEPVATNPLITKCVAFTVLGTWHGTSFGMHRATEQAANNKYTFKSTRPRTPYGLKANAVPKIDSQSARRQ